MNSVRTFAICCVSLVIFLFCHPGKKACYAHILRVADGATVSISELVRDLQEVRVVFIGEQHDKVSHHRAQLQVIEALPATQSFKAD